MTDYSVEAVEIAATLVDAWEESTEMLSDLQDRIAEALIAAYEAGAES